MNVSNVQATNFLPINKTQSASTANETSFKDMLNDYIQQTDNVVKDFEAQSVSLAKGEAVNLHDVTIAAQKASIAVSLTTQVRDKMVEAYQEMMRMQI